MNSVVDWILANLGGAFGWIGGLGLQILIAVERPLVFSPWFVLVVVVSVAISIAFGIPVGIAMAWSSPLKRIPTPILDAMQTMPSFVYLTATWTPMARPAGEPARRVRKKRTDPLMNDALRRGTR